MGGRKEYRKKGREEESTKIEILTKITDKSVKKLITSETAATLAERQGGSAELAICFRQLTLEQHSLELCTSTYMWILFNRYIETFFWRFVTH